MLRGPAIALDPNREPPGKPPRKLLGRGLFGPGKLYPKRFIALYVPPQATVAPLREETS